MVIVIIAPDLIKFIEMIDGICQELDRMGEYLRNQFTDIVAELEQWVHDYAENAGYDVADKKQWKLNLDFFVQTHVRSLELLPWYTSGFL